MTHTLIYVSGFKDDFKLIKGDISSHECRRKCSADDDCTGFEYRSGDDDYEQCELWKTTIKSVEEKDVGELECCKKKKFT